MIPFACLCASSSMALQASKTDPAQMAFVKERIRKDLLKKKKRQSKKLRYSSDVLNLLL